MPGHLSAVRTAWLAAVCALGVTTACTKPEGARPTLPGDELYAICLPCHGPAGEGNAKLKAPAIAGLPKWYLEAQLVKFQAGVRGSHPDDLEGLRMRPMSRQLMNRAEVESVATFVAALPPRKAPATLTGGNAGAGQTQFAVCVACHGADGKGNEQLKAPPLAGQADWYLLSQLGKFKAGQRGVNPADVTGGQMRPMALTLVDEQAMKNVVAHISTLNR